MDLASLKKNLEKDFSELSSKKELQDLKVKYQGKKGILTNLSKSIKSVKASDRPKVGRDLSEIRNIFEKKLLSALSEIKKRDIQTAINQEKVDISLPASFNSEGQLHPITKTIEKISIFFASRGYLVEDGPEIETEHYNFDALNIPSDHPARDMHDTFYLQGKKLLRTHTSPVQIRAIKKRGAPLRIICPGKVYRSDADKTHTPMFHQIEGLVIDEKINFGHLKKEIMTFIEFFFGSDTESRFRPSYFPFTEPSAEVDIMDEKTKKWLEIMGCGLVHPNVLKIAGVNPRKYSGFAFGLGIERMAKLFYEIDDMRSLYSNDIKFLSQ